jgi:hypothetical protein
VSGMVITLFPGGIVGIPQQASRWLAGLVSSGWISRSAAGTVPDFAPMTTGQTRHEARR